MARFFKYVILILIFSGITFFIVNAKDNNIDVDYEDIIPNFGYIETKLLESSRYTQPNEISQERLDYYHDNMIFRPSEEYLSKYKFVSYPELEDDYIKVYFEKDSFSVIVYDKVSDYYYSSRPTHQGYEGVLEGNRPARSLLNSGLWIDHVRTDRPAAGSIITDSLYTLANVSFVSGEQEPDNPFTLTLNSYNRNNVDVNVERVGTGINVLVDASKLEFKFNVLMSVKNGVLTLQVLEDSIEENSETVTVLGITLLPYLGATRHNLFPSHFVIPDGLGALVQHTEARNTHFEGRFFGDDIGYPKRYNNHLGVPLFGLIHETNKAGFYAHITKGAEQSILAAKFYGTGNNYNRIYSTFYIREIHRRIIDRNQSGSDYVTNHRVDTDYEINYNFLQENANYVGIANHYRDYLLNSDKLNKVEMPEDISLYTTYIMGDLEPSLFSKTRINMTTANQALKMYLDLQSSGVINQKVGLLGYSNEGVSSGLTKMNFHGGVSSYYDLFEQVKKDNTKVYLNQNYVDPIGDSSRINEIRDVAKTASKLLMKYRVSRDGTNYNYQRYLQPEHTFLKARNDQKILEKYDLGIVMSSLGNNLFTTYRSEILDREESMAYYIRAAELNDDLILNQPNSYLWQYIKAYNFMPIANSQYVYYTDLVPLIPIILQGIMPKYSQYLNFNALGKDRLLQLVDFNVYPHFILTHEKTFKMRNTNSSIYYSTYYEDYKDEMIKTYKWLNTALRHVIDTKLVKRDVLEVGVVKNTYENGVVIIINYTTSPKTVDSKTIRALEYEVILP